MGNCCCCIPSEQEITVDKQNEDMNNNETVDIVDNVKDENVESNDENGELDNAENERLIEEENDNGECENACITENNENVSEKLDDKSVDKDSLESDKEDDTHFYGSGRIYDNEEKISERDSSLRRGLTDSTYACQVYFIIRLDIICFFNSLFLPIFTQNFLNLIWSSEISITFFLDCITRAPPGSES